MSFVFFAAVSFFSAVFLNFGCSKKADPSPPVAVIGGEAIPVEEIIGPLLFQGRLFVSPEEELAEKNRLLDSIIDVRLLVQEAYRLKLDKDSLVRAFEEEERPLFLSDVLYFHEVRDKARLAKAEVLRFYRALKVDRCYRQILTRDRRRADSLLALVRAGARFDSLAMMHSKDPFSAPTGGDIGCYGWNKEMPEELFERTLEMKPGELAGPFQLPGGWVILQCYEQRPAVLPDMRVFEPQLRNILEPLREAKRSARFVAEIRKELGFRIVDSAARFVNVKQQELSRTPASAGQPERYSVYIRTEELAPGERDMPLLTYKGGVFTVGRYLETLQGTMPLTRLNVDNSENAKAVLFQLVFLDVMSQTALSKGLDKDPEFLKLLKGAVEGEMARLLRFRIYSAVSFDTARTRAYYQAHPDEFLLPSAVHLFEINRPSQEDILGFKQSVRNKAQLTATAAKLTARPQLRLEKGDMGWVEKHQFPELFAAASKMKIGTIAGPVPLADGSFSLIYLEARRQAHKQSFAEVRGGLLERLLIQVQDSALAVWMAEAKKKTKVTVYPEVLDKTIDRTYYAKLKEWQDKQKGGKG